LPLLICPCLWYYGYLGRIPAQKDPLGANEHYDSTVEKKQAGATLILWASIAGSRWQIWRSSPFLTARVILCNVDERGSCVAQLGGDTVMRASVHIRKR
jgi:hypothetical protein